jgi:hypothetical protein
LARRDGVVEACAGRDEAAQLHEWSRPVERHRTDEPTVASDGCDESTIGE